MSKTNLPNFTLLLVITVWFISCNEDMNPANENWLAKVGNSVITTDDVDLEMQSLTRGDLFEEQNRKELLEIKKSILNELIEEKLLLQEAERRKIVVSPDEIDERLRLTYGSSEKDKLDEIQETTGFDAETLRQKVMQTLLVEKLFTRDVFPRILVSKEELEKEYQANPEKYSLPERVHVRQIVVPTEEEAIQALRRIWRGDSFAELAKELSVMPEKNKGGDLGWVKKGEYPDPLNEYFFTLPKRTYNKPVKSEFGYHLIHIMDHEKAVQLDFDKAKRLVEKDLFKKKKEEVKKDLLESLVKRYKVIMNKNKPITEGEK